MACCGGRPKKTTSIARSNNMFTQNVPAIPGEKEGMVLVTYTGGKGKGKHYYRGPVTKFAYKVKHGQTLNVDPLDVIAIAMFETVAKPKTEKVLEVPKKIVRTPRRIEIDRTPEEVAPINVPDISSMNYQDVLTWLDDIKPDPESAAYILDIEKKWRNRVRVKAFLERRL